MHEQINLSNTPIKRALLSVSNKQGLIELAQGLMALNIEIISTGGTCNLLRDAGIDVKEVSDVTDFPEIMDGRVKTLHPKIHGGILGRRDEHAEISQAHAIQWIDLVVVNLYPFTETIQRPNVAWEEAIENIDIGGPAMIRSAAKNMEWTAVVVDPADYPSVLEELNIHLRLSDATRRKLATKAFGHTANYDKAIYSYLCGQNNSELSADRKSAQFDAFVPCNAQQEEFTAHSKFTAHDQFTAPAEEGFPPHLNFSLEKALDLRYGENPHQAAAAYRLTQDAQGVLSAKQYQGKQLSYNNLLDADAVLSCLSEFDEPACVIVKHTNPCGAATAERIDKAFSLAFNADSQSAFGGVVGLNRTCTAQCAAALEKVFIEILIAPDFDEDALAILQRKTQLRILQLPFQKNASIQKEFTFIEGAVLIQQKDQSQIVANQLQCVTKRQPNQQEMLAMLFSWRVLKHIKSNAILIARENVTLGVGAGQVSRIDSVHMAIRKAGEKLSGAILASDAFFPFRDSIDYIAKSGIKAIIQPGGSIRDQEVIDACNENAITMLFTGQRCFKH